MASTSDLRPEARAAFAVAPPGVYSPQEDSFLLAESIRREGLASGLEVLDVCAGSGFLSVYAARLGARVTAVDISRRAVLTARLNALFAAQRVEVRRGDLLAALGPERMFDLLVSNPPYVPSPLAALPRRGASRCWEGGWDGRALVDRVCDGASSVLRPGGVVLLVHSALSGPERSVRRLNATGLRATVSRRAAVRFGPVLRERLPWLRERGLVASCDDSEELVVIRGEKV